MNRKQLMSNALNPQAKKTVSLPIVPKQPSITFFHLPAGIINQVLEYSGITLGMRVINRRFSDHVLRHINKIRLHDEVDEKTFNKLAKWAV